MATILICGSRHWTDKALIRAWLSKLPKDTEIIHGACRGADVLAGDVAKELGFKVREFPADWETHGKAGGPIRNEQMILEGRPARVFAFTEALMRDQRPTGTSDCVMRALNHGITVTIIPAKRLSVPSLTRAEEPPAEPSSPPFPR